jgi:inosine-uridine nucleoside N-ribohydrolase
VTAGAAAARIVIDCDPGLDDAIALLLALASPELAVEGITTVAGNAPLVDTTANALRVLEFAGRAEIPVAAGADRPWLREPAAAPRTHGETGLGGAQLPPADGRPDARHAIDLIAELAHAGAQPLTLVAIGPLTNVATLVARHPQAAARLRGIVLMGGAIGLGNTTPAAEFNIWADPEAAQRVFTSGLDVIMVGLDVTHQALVTPADAESLRGCGRAGALIADMIGFYGRAHTDLAGSPIHDAVAVAHLIDPDLLELSPAHVGVDRDDLCRGRTVVDLRGRSGPPNCRVATAIRPGFADFLIERVTRLG